MPLINDAISGSLANHGGLPRVDTTFYDVKCHEGFHCVSSVDVFGRGHDGEYHGLPAGKIEAAKYRGAYEDGCPARGIVTPANECRDLGKGPVKFCWSSKRFEAGPESPCKEEDDCMCVKDTPNGTGRKNVTKSQYEVQPRADCEDCAQHNCDHVTCDKCNNCEYGTKVIAGRMSKGCFFLDAGMSSKKRRDTKKGRGYLFAGMDGIEAETKQKKLTVIPHDKIWDPSSKRNEGEQGSKPGNYAQLLSFPFQSRSEPLSKSAWVTRYRRVAPQIQHLMDITAENIKMTGPKASEIDCDWDIAGRIYKFNSFRRACQHMQSVVDRLAKKTPFESTVPDGTGGFRETHCLMGGQGMCANLNCYSDDVDVNKGIDQIQQRATICYRSLKLLHEEEEVNGPVEAAAQETARDGGRLEVPVKPGEEAHPPLPAETPAMSPVEAGLAIITAVGAGASSWQRMLGKQSGCGASGSRPYACRSFSLDRCRAPHRKQPEAIRDFLCGAVD